MINPALVPPTPPAAVPGLPIVDAAGVPPGPPAAIPGLPGAGAAAVAPGLPALFPAEPIAKAAAALPTPPVEVLPRLAEGVAMLLSPPQLTIPGIPGIGVPLPKTISAPQDLICIGTGWSAETGSTATAPPAPPVARWGD